MNTTKTAVFHSKMMRRAQQAKKTALNTQKRSAKEADEKCRQTTPQIGSRHRKIEKWRQALRVATQSQGRRTRKTAKWNPGLIISTKTQGRAGRPAKRWEDDLNVCVTEATHSNDLKKQSYMAHCCKTVSTSGRKERQNVRHVVDD